MEEKLTDLDLFDLLSEQHFRSRKAIENIWNEHSNTQLSNTEWFILYQLYGQNQTIIELCKNVDITRQAMHKLINKMEERGLVITGLIKNKKYAQITELGSAYYEKNKALKNQLEDKIKNKIGEEAYIKFKNILTTDWGIE